jgi:thymidylate kinase
VTRGSHIIIEHPEFASRNVTLICGPPGSGKTTLASTLHKRTLDIGDLPAGTPRQRMKLYGRVIYKIGRSVNPNTAVVRCAPTREERIEQQRLCRPARTIILLLDANICRQRVIERNRTSDEDGRDVADQLEAIDDWWSKWAP